MSSQSPTDPRLTELPPDGEEGVEYEYEYVEVDADGELPAGSDADYVVEYVDENGQPIEAGDAAEVEYEEVMVDAETGEVIEGEIDPDAEVEYEYVTEDVGGTEVSATEPAAEGSFPSEPAPVPRTDSDTEVVYKEVTVGSREVPAWVTSLGVHLAVLGLCILVPYTVRQEAPPPTVTSILEEVVEEDYTFDEMITEDVMGTKSDKNLRTPSKEAATRMGVEPQEEVERQVEETFAIDEVPPPVVPFEPHTSELLDSVDLTGATEMAGGTEGAMDRLAMEIAASLKERETLVVWMFDASQSLTKDRTLIADRFDNVYKQVGEMDVEQSSSALKTAVMSFGKTFNFMTDTPVNHAEEAAGAIRQIENDASGDENVFTAVLAAAKKFEKYRTLQRRNMMLVIVTDERGDDYMQLEETIRVCRRIGLRVFVVGPATIFGKEKNFVEWTYEDGYTEELPVDGGPETLVPQRVDLPFWGGNDRGLSRMSSGYGPYALTRLASETGGLYLINRDTRGPNFDPMVMKNYLPDYRPMEDYLKELRSNRAKMALVETARSSEVKDIFRPRMAFDHRNDTILRNQITEAQKPAAVSDAKLMRIHARLAVGEPDRKDIKSARWRAAYDLAMGRVLALRVRSFGYNKVLADMKSVPLTFENKESNAWRLVPSTEILGGAQVRKLAKEADEYLSRVIDEHPGTPWALLAERELSAPMGWEWQEYAVPTETRMRNNNNNDNDNIELAEEEMERKRQMEQKAARVRPKL